MKPFFNADDFNFNFLAEREVAAEKANAKLQREGVVVYGDPDDLWSKVLNDGGSKDTHRALLINIEEIEKKPCEHEPQAELLSIRDGKIFETRYKCSKCGVRLKATKTWEEVK